MIVYGVVSLNRSFQVWSCWRSENIGKCPNWFAVILLSKLMKMCKVTRVYQIWENSWRSCLECHLRAWLVLNVLVSSPVLTLKFLSVHPTVSVCSIIVMYVISSSPRSLANGDGNKNDYKPIPIVSEFI